MGFREIVAEKVEDADNQMELPGDIQVEQKGQNHRRDQRAKTRDAIRQRLRDLGPGARLFGLDPHWAELACRGLCERHTAVAARLAYSSLSPYRTGNYR